MPIQHTVEQGDCILSIAHQYKFSSIGPIAAEEANAELVEKRQNLECLLPGDVVTIPDKEEKSVEVSTGATHTFRTKIIKSYFTMLLLDDMDKELPGIKYKLVIESHGKTLEGASDGKGIIKEQIPADAKEGELTIHYNPDDPDEDMVTMVKFGHRNPVEEISGKKSRLLDLGYYFGEMDDADNDEYQSALKAFAADMGLDENFSDADIEDKLMNYHPNMKG